MVMIARKQPELISVLSFLAIGLSTLFAVYSWMSGFSTDGRPWAQRIVFLWVFVATIVCPAFCVAVVVNFVNLLRNKFCGIFIEAGELNIVEVFIKKIPVESVRNVYSKDGILYIDAKNKRFAISSLGFDRSIEDMMAALKGELGI